MKQNLSTTVSITSTYAGEFAGDYIQAALLAGSTLGNGTITIKPNIAKKQVVKKLVTSATILADGTCDFSPTATVTLTERIIEPKKIQVHLQLCKEDFRSDFEAASMGASRQGQNLPQNFADFLIANVSAQVGAAMEIAIWRGDNSAGSISGLTTLAKLDATVLDVSGTTITAANVQAELAKVVAKIATTNVYLAGQKVKIYVATDVMANYLISLGGFGASGLGSNGYKGEGPNQVIAGPVYFAGLELVETPGLNTGEMFAAQPDNLWFGTSLMSDLNSVYVLDMFDKDASDNVRFAMNFTAAVQYGIGAEIVYYWIY